MVWGAIALFIYSILVCQLQTRRHWDALPATTAALAAWLFVALGLHLLAGAVTYRQGLILTSQGRTLV